MQMAVKNRFLTKTRFKLAVECPTKLFYTGKPGIYANNSLEDDFLKALAEGGFQVGELAQMMFPGGHDIKSLDHAAAVEETNQLLLQDNVTLYEAAIQHGDLFMRVDVLTKQGNQVELIEVKAKSFNSKDIDTFSGKKGGIKKDMLPYLQDVAFQKYVASQAFPHWTISSFLMMADKSKTATVDGLNRRFKIRRDSKGRSSVTVLPGTTPANIGDPILSRVKVTHLNRERAERVERTISPQELVHYRDNWYIDAWCHLRNGIRSFGLDAIEDVQILESAAKEVDTAELRRITQGSYGIFAGQATAWAVLRFTKHRAQWVEGEQWHPEQLATREPDGSYLLKVPYSDDRELLGDILRFGADVQVLEPKELRSKVQKTLLEAVGKYV